MSRLLSWERRDPGAQVLQVTNMWPVEAESPGFARSLGPRHGIFVKRQVDSLIEAGARCDVLYVRAFDSRLAYAVAAFFLLICGLKGRRYRLVHVHSGETALAARFFLTAPVIVTYHGSDLLGIPRADGSVSLPQRLRRALQRAHARLATRTITQSREMERTLPASVQRRNLVIPNGVEPDLFRPIDRGAARKRLGWDPAERVALFAADPEVPVKRHWLARAACEWAGEHVERLRLHVATDVAPDDMPLVMSAADCLLLTSSGEGAAIVVKEAVLCNLPVVATRVGDVEEVLAGVEPSWVCDTGEPAEVGEALAECLGQPRRSNGREASALLSSETIARRHLELFEELAPGSVSG